MSQQRVHVLGGLACFLALLPGLVYAEEGSTPTISALGAKLAGVQTITESPSGRYGAQNPFGGDPFGGSTDEGYSIAAGEIEISATVHVVFRLTSTEFERK